MDAPDANVVVPRAASRAGRESKECVRGTEDCHEINLVIQQGVGRTNGSVRQPYLQETCRSVAIHPRVEDISVIQSRADRGRDDGGQIAIEVDYDVVAASVRRVYEVVPCVELNDETIPMPEYPILPPAPRAVWDL